MDAFLLSLPLLGFSIKEMMWFPSLAQPSLKIWRTTLEH
ncbi:hypothetical protein MANES_08G133611v8 [Manihot esculenta]|uniref:Uncharacterized protein n=1 Tax=Manihot esculenta TaxID=3983 RepID=A0ACB7HAX7_MANES|nr:hypothetical protein MANES_08G133611v8 [Manihot esculenta]